MYFYYGSEDGDAVRLLKNPGKSPDGILVDPGPKEENSLRPMALPQQYSPSAKTIAMDILPEHVGLVEFVKAEGCGFILKNAP